jgi:hypothetical protein
MVRGDTNESDVEAVTVTHKLTGPATECVYRQVIINRWREVNRVNYGPDRYEIRNMRATKNRKMTDLKRCRHRGEKDNAISDRGSGGDTNQGKGRKDAYRNRG